MSRFDYIKYDQKSQDTQQILKKHFEAIEKVLDEDLPEGAEKTLAIRKLEEAYMWTGKAIRNEQISRLGEHIEHVERGTATTKT